MVITIILDMEVGKKVENFLSTAGHDIKSVREINIRMQDFQILELSIQEKRIIVKMDKDFGELVYNSGYNHHGIVLLQLENRDGNEKAENVQTILRNYGAELSGKFCVYQKGKFRIRQK